MQDVAARSATMQNIYSIDNKWTTLDVSANPFAIKQMGIDAVKQMMQPSGDTRPGLAQYSTLSQFRVPVPGGSELNTPG